MIDFIINDVKYEAEAVERIMQKHIPEKVHRHSDGTHYCECGNIVKSYQNYCDECGQRLDWRFRKMTTKEIIDTLEDYLHCVRVDEKECKEQEECFYCKYVKEQKDIEKALTNAIEILKLFTRFVENGKEQLE